MNQFRSARTACTSAFMLALSAMSFAAAAPFPPAIDLPTWKEAISHTPPSSEGCFTAAYPSMKWHMVPCSVAPLLHPVLPHLRQSRTVGSGNDYSAMVTGLISSATGSFPTVSGLTHEKDSRTGASSNYSLQLNSNTFQSPACAQAAHPSKCRGWEQFVFGEAGGKHAADRFGLVFIQYWLIDYGKDCPSGWQRSDEDCVNNAPGAVLTPKETVTTLADLQLSGHAAAKGLDTITLVTSTKAYSLTAKDSIVDLAKSWNAVEFNVFGAGDLSSAIFNKGTSVAVKIALKDGEKKAPDCQAESGTTGEMNNLNLAASCKKGSGSKPWIEFTESN